MSEWRDTKLKEVCELFDGPHQTAPLSADGPVVYLNVGDIRRGRIELRLSGRVTEDTAAQWSRRVEPKSGDIVFGYEATLGEAALLDGSHRWCLGRRVGLLRPKHGRVDARFLAYAWYAPSFQETLRANRIGGSTIESIRLTDLPTWTVLLPPLPEQRAIAHILGTLDDKIELNRRMNETLEAMARALFKSWFVDFDPVRAKMEGRDTGLPPDIAALFPDRMVDSELGEIPEGWEVGTVAQALAELEVGGRPKGGVAGYSHGVPSIGAESIVGLGVFDYTKTKYVPREYFDQMTKGHLKSGDVLLYKDGGRPGEFEPHVTLFGNGFPFRVAAINEHVYRLRATHLVGQEFLLFWLSTDRVMDEMRVRGTGVAVPGLNSTQVKSLTMLLPPMEVTSAFERRVAPIVARVLAACTESRTLSRLRDGLLPKLISGDIRVGAAERAEEAL